MKILTLIIHANAQRALADRLRADRRVSGFTFVQAEGHGEQGTNDPLWSARDNVVGYTPRVRVDILLEDAQVEAVLAELRLAGAGVAGQGIYWVTPVERGGHL